jgi:zinc protease
MRDGGVTEKELVDAKTYINGSFPLRLTSSGRIAGLLLAMQRHDLGLDYLERRAGIYDAITLADVARVAKRLLQLEKMYVVVVGDPQGVESDK